MTDRDGASTSIWQATVPYYTGINSYVETAYDVVIAGGGITGLSIALALQKAGKKCMVLEAQTLCFGTTGGTTAHLNTLLESSYHTISKNFSEETANLIAEATRESIELIRRNIKTYDINCSFAEATGWLYAQSKKQAEDLRQIYESALKAGVAVSYDTDITIPVPFERAIRIEKQARIHPIEYVYGLARAFEDAGGMIMQHCRVLNVEGDDLLRVETSRGDFEAQAVVYATHIPMGVNLLHLRCTPYRSYVMAVRLVEPASYPQGLVYDLEEPYHYFRTHLVDEIPYLIVGGEDHKTGHEENTEKPFLRLEAYIRKYFKVDHVAYKWSSQYFMSADGLPYIGHLPGHPNNIYVATGYGGNGITYSGVATSVLKSLIMSEENALIDVFDPNRIKPVAGFTNFIKQNADVAGQLFSSMLPADALDSFSDLAPGEGRVVKYEGETIAISKDTDGQLHAVNPTCTHLKCTVEWNDAEQSWDCPCHGARYGYDGKVLTGPASRNLDAIEITALVEEEH